MKVFNTHIEALKYLIEKPLSNKIKNKDSFILWVDATGVIRCEGQEGVCFYISNFYSPFTAVEPEKTNEDYVEELCKIWDTQAPRDIFQRQLEIMDEKIKKAKDE